MVERFCRYVECSSESGRELAFCELLEKELVSLGLDVQRDCVGELCGSNGWNIYACLNGNNDAILFSAHLDTVDPGINIKPVVFDGVIKSDGNTVLGADDKAGVACIMESLESIVEGGKPHRTVEILFSVCEETGLLGAKFADYNIIRSRAAVVLDNENLGEIINCNPANMVINFQINGKAAHAGMAPEEGIHALKAAAKAVADIPVGNVDEISVMNISNFISPGKTNVIANKACFDMEIRSFEEDRLQEHITASENAVKAACEAFGADYTMILDRHSDVIYVPENSDLIAQVKNIYSQLGVQSGVVKSFGGCDATHIFARGIEVINLGIGMQAVHSRDEYISVGDLVISAKLVNALMTGSI